MGSNFTLFTNDSGAAGGPVDYVKDAFKDISLEATNNSGLTSSASTNPLSDLFANDDSPRLGAKVLWIKDLILEDDSSKWVNNKPTYRIVWHENFISAKGYVFGDVALNGLKDQPYVTFRNGLDGLGVAGIIQRVAFLVQPSNTTNAFTIFVDGSSNTSTAASNIDQDSLDTNQAKFSMFASTGLQTKNLHDFRIVPSQINTLKVLGVIVYFENSGANIECLDGTTYVDKNKTNFGAGASLSVPAAGSSLGSKVLIIKSNTLGAYTTSSQSCSTVVSIGQGSSGSNLLSVSTGHGSSFPQGSGIALSQGTSHYVGSVLSISTDTLTMSETFTFGISQSLYRAWMSSPTLAINASFFIKSKFIDFQNIPIGASIGAGSSALSGSSNFLFPLFDIQKRYAVFGSNVGVTVVSGQRALAFFGASGYLQVDGYFSAADFNLRGAGTWHATMMINGGAGWGMNEGVTGAIRRAAFSEAGPGWNSVVFSPGPSMTSAVGVQDITLYERQNTGVTFGRLAEFDVSQSFGDRSAINASLMALGLDRRVYADQLFLSGAWDRGTTHTMPGGAFYRGTTTSAVLSFQWFGSHVGIVGTPGGGTLAIDGVGVGLTFNYMHRVGGETFHSLTYTSGSGSTSIIAAVDYVSTRGEFRNLQNFDPIVDDDTKTEPVVAIYAGTSAGTFAPDLIFPLNYSKRIVDTHNIVTTGQSNLWRCVIPKKAKYNISASWSNNSAGGVVYTMDSRIVVNGVPIRVGTANGTMGSSTRAGVEATINGFPLNIGDVLTIEGYGQTSDASSLTVSGSGTPPNAVMFSISEVR